MSLSIIRWSRNREGGYSQHSKTLALGAAIRKTNNNELGAVHLLGRAHKL